MVLFQWPATKHCDSLYVRCTKIQRIMRLFSIPYKVASVGAPATASKDAIAQKVNPLMRRIPILKVSQDHLVEETDQIISFLCSLARRSSFEQYDNLKQQAQFYFFQTWIDRWLVWMVIYARFTRDDNFNQFVKTIDDPEIAKGSKDAYEYIRKRAVAILKTTEVGRIPEKDYLLELQTAFRHLNELMAGNRFLTGPAVKDIDMSLFMCIQAFADPSLKQESVLLRRFPAINEWYRRICKMTGDDVEDRSDESVEIG